jgi:hypothetical protein
MSRLIVGLVIGACPIVTPGRSFAQSKDGLTRAQVRAELVRV